MTFKKTERPNDKKTDKKDIEEISYRQDGKIIESKCHHESQLLNMNDIIDGDYKNEFQQILPSTLSISDVQTSNRYITTNRKSIYIYKVAHLLI